MSFFDNPKTRFVFGAEWNANVGVSGTSQLAPFPVDKITGAVPTVNIVFNSAGSSYYNPKQLPDNTDAQAAEVTGLQGVVSRLELFNGATFDRARSLASNADAQVAEQIGLIGTVSRGQVYNGATFDRIASIPDNADAQAVKVTGLQGVVSRLQGWNGATFDRLISGPDNADAQVASDSGHLTVADRSYAYNGASWDRRRASKVFKTGNATAIGSTAIWTPAVGKKFRLLGYELLISRNATLAVAGELTVSLLDAAGAIGFTAVIYVPNILTPGNLPAGPVSYNSLGDIGYLSALVNNPLNLNLSVALVTGTLTLNVRGTEE